MTLKGTFRLFRIVVQEDNELWLIELPPEDSDTIGDVSLLVLLSEQFGDELDYDEDAYPEGPLIVYEPDDMPTEDFPEADSCAFVVCLTRQATLEDADRVKESLRIWLAANNEQAEIIIENPA